MKNPNSRLRKILRNQADETSAFQQFWDGSDLFALRIDRDVAQAFTPGMPDRVPPWGIQSRKKQNGGQAGHFRCCVAGFRMPSPEL